MNDPGQTRPQVLPPGKSRLEQLPENLKHQISRHLGPGDSTRLALTSTLLCKFFFHKAYKSLGLHSTLCSSAENGNVNFVQLAISEGAEIDYKGTKPPYIGCNVVDVAVAAEQLPVILYFVCLEVLHRLGVEKVNKSIMYILANSTEVNPRARDCTSQLTHQRQTAWSPQQDGFSRPQRAFGARCNLCNGDNSYQYGTRFSDTPITGARSPRPLDRLGEPEHCLAFIKALLEPGVDVNGNCPGANMTAAINDLWGPTNAKQSLDIVNVMLQRLYKCDIKGVMDKALRLACMDKTKESSVELIKLLLQSQVSPTAAKRQDEIQAAVKRWWPQAVSNSSIVFTKIMKLLTEHGFDRTVAGEISATLGLEAEEQVSGQL